MSIIHVAGFEYQSFIVSWCEERMQYRISKVTRTHQVMR